MEVNLFAVNLFVLCIERDCFMKISLQTSPVDWREIFMKQTNANKLTCVISVKVQCIYSKACGLHILPYHIRLCSGILYPSPVTILYSASKAAL